MDQPEPTPYPTLIVHIRAFALNNFKEKYHAVICKAIFI